MMRLVLWSLVIALVLLLGGVFGQMMTQDAGVITVTWNGWFVETTFWTGVGLLISFFVFIVFIYLLVKRFGPSRLMAKYRNRRDQKMAKKETAIAIESWLKGADDRALKALQRVINAGGSDRLPSAVSLAIGLDHGDWSDRYAHFIQNDPELKLFADTLQAERFWQAQKEDDFIDLMQSRFELRQIPWLRERFWQSLSNRGKATELVRLVNEAANIQPEVRESWLVKAASTALTQSQGEEHLGSQILKPLTRAQRSIPAIVIAEVTYLQSIGQAEAAFKRAKQLLSSVNHSENADVLLDLKVENSAKLSFLETLDPVSPGPVFCRTNGVVHLRQQLWGTAQSWLEQGWQQGDKASGVYLADLFEQRKMHEQASRLYRELATGLVSIN